MPEDKPTAERPAFAGVLFRGLAFILDCVLLYYVFKVLDITARPVLLALNPLLPYLGHVLVFLYFWIGYGPLTKGQTAAKALTGMAVVGRDGQPLGWGAAARRALLIQGVFAIFLSRNTPATQMIFPAGMWIGAYITMIILAVMAFTLFVMMAFGTIFHPYKRGWHDLWAGSYVTSAPVPAAFRQMMDSDPGVVIQRKMANNFRITFFFWIIVTLVLLVEPVKFLISDPKALDTARAMQASQLHYSTPAYRLSDVTLPSAELKLNFAMRVRFEQDRARSAGQSVPTTATLAKLWMSDDETIQAAYFRRNGAYQHADLAETALRDQAADLRREMWRQWQKSNGAATSGTLRATTFSAWLFEPLGLVMYNETKPRGRVYGPADPAQGGLIFEDVLQPLPQTADQPTTPTAAPAAARSHETPRP